LLNWLARWNSPRRITHGNRKCRKRNETAWSVANSNQECHDRTI